MRLRRLSCSWILRTDRHTRKGNDTMGNTDQSTDHSYDSIAGIPLDRWHEMCREYIEKMAEIPPERRRHANCDHAYGICSA
jgi:hypothetical protein